MKYSIIKLTILLSGLLIGCIQHIFAQNDKSGLDNRNAINEINVLMENFQKAIIEKDSLLFFKIFFDKNTPIIGVMSEPTEMSIKLKNPNFQGLAVSNSQRFIREICSSTNQQREIFENTKVKIDDRIATVRFDYAFLVDNKIHQWGQECWSLVFAEGQWFISGINFTIRYPKIEQPSKKLRKAIIQLE